MQVTLERKKTSIVVWIIVAIMVIGLLALVVFYAYQKDPTESLPSDRQESSNIIYYNEV